MRFAIFGTGGAGGYFGAHLARAGLSVTFIARGEHLNAIRSKGLLLRTSAGEIRIHPAEAHQVPVPVNKIIHELLLPQRRQKG